VGVQYRYSSDLGGEQSFLIQVVLLIVAAHDGLSIGDLPKERLGLAFQEAFTAALSYYLEECRSHSAQIVGAPTQYDA